MKRLTLNETWEQCLKMWRWIVGQKCPRNVVKLKKEWFRKHKFVKQINNCFFCEYIKHNSTCKCCPVVMVDKTFRCGNGNYNYRFKPATFLRKITELNKIRLAEKRK